MAKKETEDNIKDKLTVASALKKCKGRTKKEILHQAAKLNAGERLAIMNFFEIEPQNLGSTIVLFWLEVEKGGKPFKTLLDEPFFVE